MKPPSIGLVVVTSPARVHPSTELVWSALGSTSLIRGLEDCPITLVCDGYRTVSDLNPDYAARIAARLDRDPVSLSKRGIVPDGIGGAYEEYKERLRREIDKRGLSHRITVDSFDDGHRGFALCVEKGLRTVQERGLKYAMVLQHDRAFIRRFERSDLQLLLSHFERDDTCRYIGFASSTSKMLASRMQPKYKLGRLTEARSTALRDGLMLRPSIFWYDSNHLVHVERALDCLFSPFTHAPPSLKPQAGALTLRRGDFIEDRFGTQQRAMLTGLHAAPMSELLEAFDFFGSYLLEEVVDDEQAAEDEAEAAEAERSHNGPSTLCDLRDSRGRCTHVAHMDARGAKPREWLHRLPQL